MVNIIFRHITGSRATEIDVVPLGAHRELILGRAPSAAVRFDQRGDICVGRHHARIAPSDDDPTRLVLADLRSRNGTFVNGVRVEQSVALRPGDVVRLGQCGPEIEVRVEVSTDLPPPVPSACSRPPERADRRPRGWPMLDVLT